MRSVVALLILGCFAYGYQESLSDHPGSYLGIGVQEVDSEQARELKLKEERGVVVTRIAEDSPAAKAGFRVGDVVLEYNGQRVEGVEQFMRMVRETPPGREARLAVFRSGAVQQISAVTGARKSAAREGEFLAIKPKDWPDMPMLDFPRPAMSWRIALLGIDAEALDGQLADYFGVRSGVLIRSVLKGFAADRASLKAGDVITRIDEARVGAPAEVSSAIRTFRNHRSFAFRIVREKHDLTISVNIEDSVSGR